MNQELDKIFRNKLESYQKPAPGGAWNKVEKNLKGKQHQAIWLKIAASISLLAIAVYFLWPKNETSLNDPKYAQQVEIKSNKNEKQIVTAEQNDNSKNKISNPTITQSLIENKNSKKDKAKTQTQGKQKTIHDATPANLKHTELVNDTTSYHSTLTTPVPNTKVVAANQPIQNNSTTIIYRVDEVNEKYLNYKAFTDATTDQKKTSKLKKLLSKAKGLKNNQDPFGELREKKNEILALNLSKEKTKHN